MVLFKYKYRAIDSQGQSLIQADVLFMNSILKSVDTQNRRVKQTVCSKVYLAVTMGLVSLVRCRRYFYIQAAPAY